MGHHEKDRACESKVPYATRSEARTQLRFIKKRSPAKGQEVYKCRFCDFWHIGRQMTRRGKRKRKESSQQYRHTDDSGYGIFD